MLHEQLPTYMGHFNFKLKSTEENSPIKYTYPKEIYPTTTTKITYSIPEKITESQLQFLKLINRTRLTIKKLEKKLELLEFRDNKEIKKMIKLLQKNEKKLLKAFQNKSVIQKKKTPKKQTQTQKKEKKADPKPQKITYDQLSKFRLHSQISGINTRINKMEDEFIKKGHDIDEIESYEPWVTLNEQLKILKKEYDNL